MIVDKITKGFISRSDKPNENWTDNKDNYFVFDDNSELGQKILKNAPYFDFIIDGSGEVIDIILTEKPPIPLQEIKQQKIIELNTTCEQEILAGFYSTARGIKEWFTNSRDDQNRVVSQASIATLNPEYIPEWKSASEIICTPFTMVQMVQLATDGANFMTERIKTFETKRNQVVSSNSINEVNAIAWVEKIWS